MIDHPWLLQQPIGTYNCHNSFLNNEKKLLPLMGPKWIYASIKMFWASLNDVG